MSTVAKETKKVFEKEYVTTVDYRSPEAAKQFSKSLEETGFALIENHPISQAEFDGVYADWKKFFALSETEKMRYRVTDSKQDGYYPFLAENGKGQAYKNLMEYFHYYYWSDKYPAVLSEKTRRLHERLVAIAETLLGWLQSQLPDSVKAQLSMPLTEMLHDTPNNTLRVIHYPPLRGNEEPDAIRTSPHEDIDLLTVLPAATLRGLQVLDLKGHWHTLATDPGMLVINAGDMLQMCTRGYYRSTTHRVINPNLKDIPNEPRYSMPLFCHPRPEVRLNEHYTAKEYLFERLAENGVKKD